MGRLDRALGILFERSHDRGVDGLQSPTGRLHQRRGIPDRNRPTVPQQRDAYRGIIYRCVNIRARAIARAMLQFTVKEQLAQGDYADAPLSHLWTQIITRPNPVYSAYRLWLWASRSYDLAGHADFVIERDTAGQPLYLWPVWQRFGHMQPIADGAGGIASWVYNRADGHIKPYEAGDVLRVANPDPHTPYESWSILQAAAFEIDIDLYASIYRRSSLKEDGYPEVYLKSDEQLDDLDVRQYQRQYRKYRGAERTSDDIPVLGKGLEFRLMGLAAKDLQFIEGKGLNKTDILQIFGIPEGLLSQEANRANSQEHKRIFYDLTIIPRAEEVADDFTSGLRTAFATDAGTHSHTPGS